jgi:hypothetical protein
MLAQILRFKTRYLRALGFTCLAFSKDRARFFIRKYLFFEGVDLDTK